MPNVLGRYNSFPERVQGIAQFTCSVSLQELQETLTEVLHRLNKETVPMEKLTKAAPANCLVNFEFGLADADGFNFIDDEELQKLKTALKQEALQILDIFCAARYKIKQPNGKSRSLKFDYDLLRFSFQEKTMELFVHHERGNQRIPLEDLVSFLASQLNKRLTEKSQKAIALKSENIL